MDIVCLQETTEEFYEYLKERNQDDQLFMMISNHDHTNIMLVKRALPLTIPASNPNRN